MKAPRGWCWDFLLHFSTFGLYTCFWIVGRLREFRRLGQRNVRPWLWFFVPILTIAQIFALPRLAGFLRSAEAQSGITPWGASRYLWILAIIAVTTFFNFQQSLSVPVWTILPGLVIWAALFVWFEARLNAVKQQMDACLFRQHKRGFSLVEWLIVVPLFPFAVVALSYGSLGSLGFYDKATLPADTVYEDPESRFRFPVTSDGWTEVEAGTFSEGDAILELRGPVDNLYVTIFHYPDLTLEELAVERRATFHDVIRQPECRESRRFAEQQLAVVSNLICTGRSGSDPALVAGSIFETDGGLYEMVGHMSVPRLTFNRLRPEVLSMAREFGPL